MSVPLTAGSRCPPWGRAAAFGGPYRTPQVPATGATALPGAPSQTETRRAPIARARQYDRLSMSAPPAAGPPPRILIPRWIQLVGLPLAVFFAWVFGQAAGHALFLFLLALLIALLLDPLVLALGRLRVRRGLSVAFVYLTFAAVILVILIALGTVVVSQTKTAANRFNDYFTVKNGQTAADRDVNRLQHWLDTHHLRGIKIEQKRPPVVKRIRQRDVGKYTHRIVNFVEGAAISIGKAVFDFVLIVVVVDLHAPRHAAIGARRGPALSAPQREAARSRGWSTRSSRTSAGSSLLSLIIGSSAGLGLYILGATGVVPGADNYALLFGGWVARDRGAAVPRAAGSARSRRRSTRSSCTRSRRSGSSCSSSASTSSRATSSSRR